MDNLTQTASLTLPLQQSQDVTLAHGALHVSDNAAVLVIQELYADLSHVASVASTAQHPEIANEEQQRV